MKLNTHIPVPPRKRPCVSDPSWAPVPRVRRILVADDDEDIRRLISNILAGDGFDVFTASDGEQAWEALLHERYDLIVADNEMPRLMGIQLIERIREAGMSLPVIIASGTLSKEGVRDYAELQITAVIPKPFDIREFLTIVRLALRVSGEGAAADHGTFRRLQTRSQPIH
jgi:DNA-binding response OmpR family regulator